MNLIQLRRKIDQLDAKIVELLNKRAEVAIAIARVKKKKGESLYSPQREREVLERVRRLSCGPLSPEVLEAVYREIMSFSLAAQRPLRIGYLGPPASFTHLASIKHFGSRVEYVSLDNISDIFLEAEKSNIDYGVVPIENSIEGAVTHTLDMFIDSDLKICNQITLEVSHNLLANCLLAKIKRIYSNPQVFGQCRLWLQRHMPEVEKIEVSSTTRAAQIAAKEKSSACIASSLAAKVYGLKIIARSIEDMPYNVTRFLIIGKTEAGITGNDKTSLMFSVKDRVGALHDMLVPFKKYGINLTKIESRPSKKKPWDYYFFVDMQGHKDQPQVKKALRELERRCNLLKILGSYPAGDKK